MWICRNCLENIYNDDLDKCWNCGHSNEGQKTDDLDELESTWQQGRRPSSKTLASSFAFTPRADQILRIGQTLIALSLLWNVLWTPLAMLIGLAGMEGYGFLGVQEFPRYSGSMIFVSIMSALISLVWSIFMHVLALTFSRGW